MGGRKKQIYGVDNAVFTVSNSFEDIKLQTFSRLKVLGVAYKKGGTYWYQCECSCGNTTFVPKGSLVNGYTKSCGCLRKDLNTKHATSKTREYKAWLRMRTRVCNKNGSHYPVYSKLGMEEDWKDSPLLFLEYIGEIPDARPLWSVGRINNSLGYFKGNVRWELPDAQARNHGISKRNTSGVTGVCRYSSGKWVASWESLEGKTRSKSFSINKYGEETAFNLACKAREDAILRLNILGAGYTPAHGK